MKNVLALIYCFQLTIPHHKAIVCTNLENSFFSGRKQTMTDNLKITVIKLSIFNSQNSMCVLTDAAPSKFIATPEDAYQMVMGKMFFSVKLCNAYAVCSK